MARDNVNEFELNLEARRKGYETRLENLKRNYPDLGVQLESIERDVNKVIQGETNRACLSGCHII